MMIKRLAGLVGVVALFTTLSIFSVPSAAAEVVGMAHSPLDYTDRLIVKFRDPATHGGQLNSQLADNAARYAGVALTYLRPLVSGAHVLKLPQKIGLEQARVFTARLSANPDVEYAEPDQLMHIALAPNDTRYPDQWHYKEFSTEIAAMNLPPAWDITTGSTTTVVAVIDTGLVAHADIDNNILDNSGRVVPGYDFINDAFAGNDGDGRDSDPSDPGDWTVANDCFPGSVASNSSWHGTHVAGTIGGLGNNGMGVSGVNWAAKILPVRVLGKCGGFLSDIADGMQWAAGLSVTGVPNNANPARVLNLSLGGFGACSATFQSAVNAAVGAGAVVVVAAGNSDSDAANFQPANCSNVITVAALNRAGGKAFYSNFGTVVEIAAPGGAQSFANDPEGILSTLNTGTTTPVATPSGDTYVYYQGTSMATPNVAGVVSLMFGVNSSLTPAQVTSALQSSARAFPTGTGSDCSTSTCGAGMINAAAAVQAVGPNAPSVSLSASPATIAAGAGSTLTWSSTNVTSCTASGAWSGAKATSGTQSTGTLSATSRFILTCTGANGSASQEITVTVLSATNQPPVANAGSDQSVRGGRVVALDGSGSSDPDGSIVSFSWRQISGTAVTLINPNNAVASFRAPRTQSAVDLVFELSVTDNQGATGVDQVRIRVRRN